MLRWSQTPCMTLLCRWQRHHETDSGMSTKNTQASNTVLRQIHAFHLGPSVCGSICLSVNWAESQHKMGVEKTGNCRDHGRKKCFTVSAKRKCRHLVWVFGQRLIKKCFFSFHLNLQISENTTETWRCSYKSTWQSLTCMLAHDLLPLSVPFPSSFSLSPSPALLPWQLLGTSVTLNHSHVSDSFVIGFCQDQLHIGWEHTGIPPDL